MFWYQLSVDATLSATVRFNRTRVRSGAVQNLHNLWDGNMLPVAGCYVITASGDPVQDYTGYVIDKVISTGASLDALTSTGAMYVGLPFKSNRLTFKMNPDFLNDNASVLSCKYHNGAGWQSLTITDGTDVSGDTLKQSGDITFTTPSDWVATYLPDAGIDTVDAFYWLKFTVDATLSSAVTISEITYEEVPDDYGNFRFVEIYGDNRVVLARKEGEEHLLYILAAYKPYAGKGLDSAPIHMHHPITGIKRFYSNLVVFGENSHSLIEGTSPINYARIPISDTVGCNHPKGIVNVPLKEFGLEFVFFPNKQGFFRFDGRSSVDVSEDVRDLWDDIDFDYPVTAAYCARTFEIYISYYSTANSNYKHSLVYNVLYNTWSLKVSDSQIKYFSQAPDGLVVCSSIDADYYKVYLADTNVYTDPNDATYDTKIKFGKVYFEEGGGINPFARTKILASYLKVKSGTGTADFKIYLDGETTASISESLNIANSGYDISKGMWRHSGKEATEYEAYLEFDDAYEFIPLFVGIDFGIPLGNIVS
ncbi:hypothetical protein DRH14_05440 [Candidatus Shapirobacteria bacterium]|nr:MAG: hypothetical protein DRH14_05440 [Candidatus Shapirobacteria bacterium]